MKISPSSAAFAWGNFVVTEYAQGCLRHLLFKQHVKLEGIPEEFAKMGEAGELVYLEYMTREQDYPFHREMPFKSEIEGVIVSGRVDFISYHDGFRIIHECKTSQSKSFLYDVIRKGIVKTNHLAQIVMYLIHLNETRAKLIARYAPSGETRTIKIEVGEGGKILVDGRMVSYSVQDQIQHQLLSAEVLKTQTVMDRANEGACRYCQFKEACLRWDTNNYESFNDFLLKGGLNE